MKQRLFYHLDGLTTDRWARQGVRTLLRAAWMGVCVWCMGLGGHLLWGWSLRFDRLGALALGAIGVGVLLLLRPRMSARVAARRLDRRFHLDEQLATAVEVAAANPPPGSIAARLVAQSERTTAQLHRQIARRQRPPWHDLLTLAALGAVAIGLFALVGIGGPDLVGGAEPLPALVEPQDPAQQLPPEQQAPGEPGQAPV